MFIKKAPSSGQLAEGGWGTAVGGLHQGLSHPHEAWGSKAKPGHLPGPELSWTNPGLGKLVQNFLS